MAKITVELDDDLEERVENAIEEAKEALIEHLDNYPSDSMPGRLDDFCDPFEIVDSATPIYTRDIETAWFLHGNELEEAYENSGLGDNPRENGGQTAIWAYISQELNNWFYRDADSVYEEWKEGFLDNLRVDADTKFPQGTTVIIGDATVVIESIEILDIEEIEVTGFPLGSEDTEEFIITDLDDLVKVN